MYMYIIIKLNKFFCRVVGFLTTYASMSETVLALYFGWIGG